MGKLIEIMSPLHKTMQRNYLERMINEKAVCMMIAKKYDFEYWDGDRKYGYGGYKYIPGRFIQPALQLITHYGLNKNSKILDVGCGKAYLLYEISKLLPGIQILGFDNSSYAVENSKKEIRHLLSVHSASEIFPYQKDEFDLVISTAVLHNLRICELKTSLQEIERVGKSKYVMVESFRNDLELFNLQCWALTARSFYDPCDWEWIFKEYGYSGDYEFIFFE